ARCRRTPVLDRDRRPDDGGHVRDCRRHADVVPAVGDWRADRQHVRELRERAQQEAFSDDRCTRSANASRDDQSFGFARMMTWLSLTTIEKSTPFALYCCMILGACALIVLRSLPYEPGPADSPTISLALT